MEIPSNVCLFVFALFALFALFVFFVLLVSVERNLLFAFSFPAVDFFGVNKIRPFLLIFEFAQQHCRGILRSIVFVVALFARCIIAVFSEAQKVQQYLWTCMNVENRTVGVCIR